MIFNEKGFTLVEVLLAVMLMGVALIPILQVMPSMYRTNTAMIIENKLSFMAQDKIEEVKGIVAGDPSNFNTPMTESATSFPDETEYWYTVDDVGADIDGDFDNDIKMVTVQAWYGGADSSFEDATHKIELITKISKRQG